MRAAKVLLVTKSTVNRPPNYCALSNVKKIVNDTTGKREQLSNSNTQSQEKIENSSKESTLQKPTRRETNKPPLTHQTRYLDIIYKRNLTESTLWERRECSRIFVHENFRTFIIV